MKGLCEVSKKWCAHTQLTCTTAHDCNLSLITQAWNKWLSACCCLGVTRQRLPGKVLTRVILRNVRAQCLSCVSCAVEGGVCADRWYPDVWLGRRFSSDEHDVEFMGDGRVYRCRYVRCFLAHQHSSKSNAGRPYAPAGTTHSATEDFPRGADDKCPSHRANVVPAEEPVHDGRCTQKVRWVVCAQESVGCGSMHEVVASNVRGWSQDCKLGGGRSLISKCTGTGQVT